MESQIRPKKNSDYHETGFSVPTRGMNDYHLSLGINKSTIKKPFAIYQFSATCAIAQSFATK